VTLLRYCRDPPTLTRRETRMETYCAHPHTLPRSGVAVLFTPDDTFYDHPEAWNLPDCAVALLTRAGSWSARNRRNGFVPSSMFARFTSDPDLAVAVLVKRNLWRRAAGGCQFTRWPGWTGTAEATGADAAEAAAAEKRARHLAAEARRQALFRNQDLKQAIRARDADQCRYCGVTVQWGKGRARNSGTYDHVDPEGDNSLENLVVACCACNSAKRRNTPAEMGMVLRDPPTSQSPPGPRNGSRNAYNASPGVRNRNEPLSDDQYLNHDQGQSSRGKGNRHLETAPAREADELVTAVVDALSESTGQIISREQALHAIGVIRTRRRNARNRIIDALSYIPAACRREADPWKELLLDPAPVLEAMLAEPPADQPDSERHQYDEDSRTGACRCEKPRSNWRHQQQEARSA
jgi:hypothetical protein